MRADALQGASPRTCTRSKYKSCPFAGNPVATQGRITSKTQTLDTLSQALHYTHAPGGQISQITTPGGNTIDYGYAQGKITSIAINGQPLISNASH